MGKPIVIDQALYGYSRGHRLLASSTGLTAQSLRTLRSVTDTTFDGTSQSYLTIIPLPEDALQAFIATWPADPSRRPGSVWSHVLLVEFSDVGRLSDVHSVVQNFARPEAPPGEDDFASYGERIHVVPTTNPRLPLKEDLARDAISSLYGSDGPVAVASDDLDAAQLLLLRMWEQQWPRLRRNCATRTRRRAAQRPTVTFDLEIVARGPASLRVASQSDQWIDTLVTDLSQPAESFRSFLQAFGAESSGGRTDMRHLATIAAIVRESPPPTVVGAVADAFPRAEQMPRLKAALVGPLSAEVPMRPWNVPEPVRIGLLLRADAGAFDLADLDTMPRVQRCWEENAGAAVAALANIPLASLPPALREGLVATAAQSAPLAAIAELASVDRDFGECILRRMPEVLGDSQLWSDDADDWDLLLEILRDTDTDARKQAFDRLVDAHHADAAAAVCALEPPIWWSSVLAQKELPWTSAKLRESAETLGRVLARVGSASVGPCPVGAVDQTALALVALAADANDGLWRQFDPERWLDVAVAASRDDRVHPVLRGRLLALGLLAGIDGSKAARVAAWRSMLWPLHRALEDHLLDEATWLSLSRRLPSGPESDRCLRMRRGAVAEVVRDRWVMADVETLVSEDRRWQAEMLAAIKAAEPTKQKAKKKSWWREIADALLP